METIALSLAGSSDPGGISIMENINRYKLKFDAPPGSEDKLPVGAKKGDLVQMVISSIIWWGPGGKVLKELEYGRLAWKGFTLDEYDRRRQAGFEGGVWDMMGHGGSGVVEGYGTAPKPKGLVVRFADTIMGYLGYVRREDRENVVEDAYADEKGHIVL